MNGALGGMVGLDPEQGIDGDAPDGAATLVIACGALARDLVAVIRANRLSHLAVACLPAILHNRTEEITAAVRAKIVANRGRFRRILCLYGDCGTGGELDRMLAEEGVERIPGAHCYAFLGGEEAFAAEMAAEPGTFFLTDYLARHFERLVVSGLGIDRFPELLPVYFGQYRRVLYLAQSDDAELLARAQAAAVRLGLAFEHRRTGLDGLAIFIAPPAAAQPAL